LYLKKDFWLKANKVEGSKVIDKKIKGCFNDKSQESWLKFIVSTIIIIEKNTPLQNPIIFVLFFIVSTIIIIEKNTPLQNPINILNKKLHDQQSELFKIQF